MSEMQQTDRFKGSQARPYRGTGRGNREVLARSRQMLCAGQKASGALTTTSRQPPRSDQFGKSDGERGLHGYRNIIPYKLTLPPEFYILYVH